MIIWAQQMIPVMLDFCEDHLGPREMLQVLHQLGEGGQEPGLRNLLLRRWRQEAGCDGGSILAITFPPSIKV